MRCECAILSSMACPALQTFFFPPYYVINGSIYEKRYIEHKMCVSIFPTTLFERFFILRRIEQDTIKMYVGLYVKYPLFLTFNVYGSVHRKYIPIYTYIYTYIYIYIQQDATLHHLFISGNCSTCFDWYLHPSSGVLTTVFTTSGICHTVTTTCRYSGR